MLLHTFSPYYTFATSGILNTFPTSRKFSCRPMFFNLAYGILLPTSPSFIPFLLTRKKRHVGVLRRRFKALPYHSTSQTESSPLTSVKPLVCLSFQLETCRTIFTFSVAICCNNNCICLFEKFCNNFKLLSLIFCNFKIVSIRKIGKDSSFQFATFRHNDLVLLIPLNAQNQR